MCIYDRSGNLHTVPYLGTLYIFIFTCLHIIYTKTTCNPPKCMHPFQCRLYEKVYNRDRGITFFPSSVYRTCKGERVCICCNNICILNDPLVYTNLYVKTFRTLNYFDLTYYLRCLLPIFNGLTLFKAF